MNVITNRTLHCTNCGVNGHIFRYCSAPVTSYGIIAMRYADHLSQMLFSKTLPPPGSVLNKIECILIQRKDSLSFIEFIRGKYSQYNDVYISKLLRGMTKNEQHRIVTRPFEELWNDIWGKSSSAKSHKNDYEASEKRFQQILHKLPQLIEENPTEWTDPEWGFPKGRRNPYETDNSCAIREFIEETGLHRNDFSVVQNISTISETFTGSNNVNYCHKYYLAICNSSTEVEMNLNNVHMTREIGAIKWCTFEEALSKIRMDNVEKREVVMKVSKVLSLFYPIHTTELFKSYSF